MTPLKKREYWKFVKESKFPILLSLTALGAYGIELSHGGFSMGTVSALRTGIFAKMAGEGIKAAVTKVKDERV